ncbi:MAG: pimeloyl-ACP methyl ester carboxylesterase [Candidatus Azotimanducaceae bacterium]|jgi:pimeloyl-ACP methyl ester carboxylesterase
MQINNFYRLLSIGALLLLAGCSPPYESIDEQHRVGQESGLRFSTFDEDGDHQAMFVAESGRRDKQMVLFVHGTPGSWQGYVEYLQNTVLSARAHLVAMDRIGFGKSDHGRVPPFKLQAASLIRLQSLNKSGKPIIVVGHSLGGSLGYRMAIDYPSQIAGLLVISASVDPELGKARWYNQMASYRAINWLLPSNLMKANIEIMPLQNELQAMQPLLSGIRSRVTVIHGEQDKLVDFGNLAFATAALKGAQLNTVALADSGHFILWEEPAIVTKALIALLDAPTD